VSNPESHDIGSIGTGGDTVHGDRGSVTVKVLRVASVIWVLAAAAALAVTVASAPASATDCGFPQSQTSHHAAIDVHLEENPSC
jgi:hypothetical protein